MTSAAEPATPAALVPPVLAAVRALKPARVASVLDEAAARLGLDLAVDEVVFPALRIVGTFWASSTLDVAHEHVLSGGTTRWMHARLEEQVVQREGRVLLAAGPQDQHTLGLDALELLLAHRGVEVCNLGGQVPGPSLVLAAQAVQPTAVVVVSHNPVGTSSAAEVVVGMAAAGHPTYYAGASFQSQFVRSQLPGRPLDTSVAAAADLVARRHTFGPTPVGGEPDSTQEGGGSRERSSRTRAEH